MKDLPPPTTFPAAEESHVDSRHSSVVDFPPRKVLPQMRGSHGDSPHTSAMDMPSRQVLLPMGVLHRDSPHSGATDMPPPTVLSETERSYVDPAQLGATDLPSSVLCLQEGTHTSSNVAATRTSSGYLQPSDNVLSQNKDLWKEEHVTKLANKLARYCYFGDEILPQSTLTGREGTALDDNKMNAILQDVRRVTCYAMTQNEFDTRIKPS